MAYVPRSSKYADQLKTASMMRSSGNPFSAGFRANVSDINKKRAALGGAPLAGTSYSSSSSSSVGGPQSGIGMPASAQNLMSEWEAARKSANAANEARYQQGLGIYDERLASMAGYGAQAKRDILDRSKANQAAGLQSLTDRGLTGTTILPTMQMGYQRQAEGELGRLGDRITMMNLGLMKDKADFIERRTDEGPNEALYSSMLDKLGQGYGGDRGGAGMGSSTSGASGSGQLMAKYSSGYGGRGKTSIGQNAATFGSGYRTMFGSDNRLGGSRKWESQRASDTTRGSNQSFSRGGYSQRRGSLDRSLAARNKKAAQMKADRRRKLGRGNPTTRSYASAMPYSIWG